MPQAITVRSRIGPEIGCRAWFHEGRHATSEVQAVERPPVPPAGSGAPLGGKFDHRATTARAKVARLKPHGVNRDNAVCYASEAGYNGHKRRDVNRRRGERDSDGSAHHAQASCPPGRSYGMILV